MDTNSSIGAPVFCYICGSRMVEHRCEIRCPNCGYTRDCSDP